MLRRPAGTAACLVEGTRWQAIGEPGSDLRRTGSCCRTRLAEPRLSCSSCRPSRGRPGAKHDRPIDGIDVACMRQ